MTISSHPLPKCAADTYVVRTPAMAYSFEPFTTHRVATLAAADTLAASLPSAKVLCNGVQVCIYVNGLLVQGAR